MFSTILKLELAFLRRQGTTYLFFAVLFLLAFYAMASNVIRTQGGVGAVSRNAPATLAQIMIGLTLVGQVITTAVVGTAILRDTQIKAHELIFTTRVTRLGYLGGRFTGSLLAMLAIFTALPLGLCLGTLMPWVDRDTVQAFQLASYVRPFVLIVVPNVIFVSALFFAVGALTRNLFAIYTQGIALFATYAIAQTILGNLDQLTLAAMTDPFGDSMFGVMTRYWTVVERNTRQIGLSGLLVTNRLIWLGVAATLVVITFAVVRLEAQPRALTWPGWRRRPVPPAPIGTPASARPLPVVSLAFGLTARWRQLVSQAQFCFVSIVREPVFLAVAVIGVINVSLGAWFIDLRYGTALWPTTGEMLAAIIRRAYPFLVILTTLYAGELVWRERQLRVAGTTDALPVPSWIMLGGKLAGFFGAMVVVELCAVLATLTVQTLRGYHHYELWLYARTLLGIALPTVFQLAALAFVVHALVNEKFVGHVVMIVYFLATLVLNALGFQRVIYQYGFTPAYIYSDMNQFRQYTGLLVGSALYFSAAACALLVLAYLLWPRGADETRRARWAAVRARWRSPGTRIAGGATALATVVTGGFLWYNTAVLNPFASTRDVERQQAAYERDFRRFKSLVTPRIVGVHVRADLVPERRTMALSSVYRVVNKHARPLDTLFVSLSSVAFHFTIPTGLSADHDYRVDSLVWSRPTQLVFADSARGVYLYRLAQPLAPGDTITLAFGGHYAAHGYPNDHPNNDLVANGTFLRGNYFPTLVYDKSIELGEDDARKAQRLPPKEPAASLYDESARANSAMSADADRVMFDAVVSTAPDQIAIAPGYLTRQWMEHGRRVFAYAMDKPIVNAISIQSGRYAVRRDSEQGIAIEVYYHPEHEVDVDRMIKGSKLGIAYYSAHFSPYQFRQFRIIEFPRYQSFAISYPNTVPFSEALGFIARVRDADNDIDWPLFATAHELAHQWWGHQIVPADQQGALTIDESLAEYSALTVMERAYGSANVQKFLRYELDRYLEGRARERKREEPLMLTENVSQLYIGYNKGSLAFFALRDYIGEDSLNSALRRYLREKAFQGPPYTNTSELLGYLRAVTPDSLRYVIHDLFETITLYDNKATAATATRRADGTYAVHLTFEARKLRADSLGTETEIPVADYIDVGVLGAHGQSLALRKVHVTQRTMAVDFVVPERPAKAGIDPFNKLIDRAPEDNMCTVDVTSG